jgi:hypothetical protein
MFYPWKEEVTHKHTQFFNINILCEECSACTVSWLISEMFHIYQVASTVQFIYLKIQESCWEIWRGPPPTWMSSVCCKTWQERTEWRAMAGAAPPSQRRRGSRQICVHRHGATQHNVPKLTLISKYVTDPADATGIIWKNRPSQSII